MNAADLTIDWFHDDVGMTARVGSVEIMVTESAGVWSWRALRGASVLAYGTAADDVAARHDAEAAAKQSN